MYHWRFIQSAQTLIQLVFLLSIAGLLLLTSSCAVGPGMGSKDELIQTVSILPVADSPELPAVIKRLMNLADEQYHQSKTSDSIVTLERAIRIKPRYPEIWSRMAAVYAHLGKMSQAKQYAERSNSYIKNNHPLKPFNDDLINSANR
jgi:Tfp pilus assembly protein PilF